jgi:hypothetical protein
MQSSLKTEESKEYTKEQVFEVIHRFLEEESKLTTRKMISEDSFTAPAWAERQAYYLGMLKALDKFTKFIPN